jgi:hypothetical protein
MVFEKTTKKIKSNIARDKKADFSLINNCFKSKLIFNFSPQIIKNNLLIFKIIVRKIIFFF